MWQQLESSYDLLRLLIDMFTTPKKSDQQIANKGRSTGMTQEAIDALKPTIACRTKATRSLIFDKPSASGQVRRAIVLTAPNTFE